MVEVLLGQGAEINATDKNGWTPLHCAARAGYLDVVKLLVESGASPKNETNLGSAPIWFAASEGHNDVLKYLMEKEHDTYALMEDKRVDYLLLNSPKIEIHPSLGQFFPSLVRFSTQLFQNSSIERANKFTLTFPNHANSDSTFISCSDKARVIHFIFYTCTIVYIQACNPSRLLKPNTSFQWFHFSFLWLSVRLQYDDMQQESQQQANRGICPRFASTSWYSSKII